VEEGRRREAGGARVAASVAAVVLSGCMMGG